MAKNTTKAMALCDEGIQHCSEPKATILFMQVKELLNDVDARDEKIEPRVKAKKTRSTKRG